MICYLGAFRNLDVRVSLITARSSGFKLMCTYLICQLFPEFRVVQRPLLCGALVATSSSPCLLSKLIAIRLLKTAVSVKRFELIVVPAARIFSPELNAA